MRRPAEEEEEKEEVLEDAIPVDVAGDVASGTGEWALGRTAGWTFWRSGDCVRVCASAARHARFCRCMG